MRLVHVVYRNKQMCSFRQKMRGILEEKNGKILIASVFKRDLPWNPPNEHHKNPVANLLHLR